jgi:hypothetical protein
MNGIIDADTHISEGEAMWKMMGSGFLPRRPIMLKVPQDTWYGNRDAFLADRRRDLSEARGEGELRVGHSLGSKRANRPQRFHHGDAGDDRQ